MSESYGGDDIKFLNKHFGELLSIHEDEKIELAIRCYEEMAGKLRHLPKISEPPLPEDKGIKFIKPFITYMEAGLVKDNNCNGEPGATGNSEVAKLASGA